MTNPAPSAAGLRVLVMGAGGGIGRACAAAFAARGAELILGDFDQARLKRATREFGGLPRFCDVTSKTSVAIFASEIIQAGTVPDVLVNAAGNGYIRTLGMMWLSHELLPAMRKAGDARLIVNLAPTRDEPLSSRQFPYATTPMAFRGLSEALARQTKGSATRVITVLASQEKAAGPAEFDPAEHAIILQTDDPHEIAATSARLIGMHRRATHANLDEPDDDPAASQRLA